MKAQIHQKYHDALQGEGDSLESRLIEHEEALMRLKRIAKWKKREKFTIVFLCYSPAMWRSLQSVYEAFAADDDFNVTILALPYKCGNNFIDEGAYTFFSGLSYNVVDGYDKQTGQWRNLCCFEPDFVFFQTPYDSARYADEYLVEKVAQYTAIGYVHYAIGGLSGNATYTRSFASHCSLNFVETESRRDVVLEHIRCVDTPRARQVCFTGHPKLDFLHEDHVQGAGPWKIPDENGLFRILWLPRWSNGEGCCFFPDYKDALLAYMQQHTDMELAFRPHPLALRTYVERNILTEEQLRRYIDTYATSDRAVLDTAADYLPTFFSSSVLVADYTSLMAEYIFTGKPIIYCHRTPVFNKDFQQLAQGFYWAQDWRELEKTLDMLRNGEDPLAERRRELAASLFHRPPGGAGSLIKKLVKLYLTGNWDPGLANGERLFAENVPEEIIQPQAM